MKKFKLATGQTQKEKVAAFFEGSGLSKDEIEAMGNSIPVSLSVKDIMMVLKFRRRIYPAIAIAVLFLQGLLVFATDGLSHSVEYIALFCVGIAIQLFVLVKFRRSVNNDIDVMIKQIADTIKKTN